MKSKSQIPEVERSARSQGKQILNEVGLLRANWVKMVRPCGGKTCRCSKSKKYWHKSWYVSQKIKGTTRMKCVPKETIHEIRQWTQGYKKIRQSLNRISDLYWNRIGKNRRA